MSDNSNLPVPIDTIKNQLGMAVKSAEQFLKPMFVSANNTKIILSSFQTITNDEQDTKALDALGKVKSAIEKVIARRKEMTGAIDNLKKGLMEPEKIMQVEYDRVKLLRDNYANVKLKKLKDEEARIQKDKDRELEKVAITNNIKYNVEMYMEKVSSNVDPVMSDFFTKITLKNFDEAAKTVSKVPKLQKEKYDALFIVSEKPKWLTKEDVDAIIKEMKGIYTYDGLNIRYQETVSIKIQSWIDRLPSKNKELVDIAALEKKNKAAAEKLKSEKANEAAIEKEALINAAKQSEEAKSEELKATGQEQIINATFAAQVETQALGSVDGVRKIKGALLNCEEKDLIIVLSELIFVCLTHPKHEGIYQKDRQGVIKRDEAGNPLYADWIESLLSFYANNCDHSISGIKVIDKVSTITKKR